MTLRVSGNSLLLDGKPVRLRGASPGNWLLLEAYMIGVPGVEQHLREAMGEALGPARANRFWRRWEDSVYTRDDLRWLAKQGFNLVRVPFNYRCMHDDERTGRSRQRFLAVLDRLFDDAASVGIHVLLDMHAAPGSQADDWNADGTTGEKRLWTDARCQDEAAAIWAELAARYRDRPNLAGYDPLCEPVWHDPEAVNAFYRKIQRAIRSADPHGLITLEPNLWGRQASTLALDLFDDANTIVQAHWYPGDGFAEHLAAWPDPARGQTIEAMWQRLEPCFDPGRIRRPGMLGEFGLFLSRQGGPTHLAMIHDLVQLLERRGIHWSMWSAKDIGQIGLLRPRSDSPWRRFLARPDIAAPLADLARLAGVTFGENMVGGELQQRMIAMFPDEDHDRRARLVREAGRHLEQLAARFVARALARLSDEELDACVGSFAFAHCDVHEGMLAALTKG